LIGGRIYNCRKTKLRYSQRHYYLCNGNPINTMKTSIYLLILCFAFGFTSCKNDGTSAMAEITPVSTEGQSFVPEGYDLVWNDEFNEGTMPDSTRWGYQSGGHGWTAKEVQMYTDGDPGNVGVENGFLRITAKKVDDPRNPFTSTRLVTKHKATFEKGYFEFRARFPPGKGLRSAIWMVGDTVTKMGWPNAGEVDIVEHYGKIPTAIGAAVQTPANYWHGKGQLGGATIVEGATDAFHVYSVEWTDDLMTFSADGVPFWTYAPLPGQGIKGWPFNWPFYLVVNLSVGGQRGAKSTGYDIEDFPANLLLDYVRVYQK
jgi:beta-glucanase (GH16 family)